MDIKVLVAYATKHGTTAEIAEKIGQVLRDSGLQADVLPVKKVKNISQYKAAVLGSAVYIAMWRQEFNKFLSANEEALSGMPVWIFSNGPLGQGDPAELSQGWKFPSAQRELLDRIKPRDIAIFQGALDPKKMGILEKWVIKNVKAPVGDFRDWQAITAWANGIAGEVKKL